MLKDENLKRIEVTGIKSLFNVSPLHAVECLRTADEIIETLDDRALIEIFEGGSNDIDKILSGMYEDIYSSLYIGNSHLDVFDTY